VKHSCLANILLSLVGILVGLVAVEAAVRLLTYDVHTPGMYVEDPDVGYVVAPNFVGYQSRPEFHTRVTTGQYGLRGADTRPRQANTVRILVLGDSQAWGFGVDDDATFSVQLERQLADHYPELDIQVLNGGVPGYGTADQLAFLESRGPILDPDLVIVQFLSVNDFKENRAPARTWATVKDGWLGHRAKAVDPADSYPRLEQIQGWIKRKSHAARLLFDSAGYLAIRFGLLAQVDTLWGEDFTEEDAELTTNLLVQIAQTARQLGAQSLLLYTTGQGHVIQDNYETPPSAAVVERAAKQADVPWINATESLRHRADKLGLYYPKNGHWTAAGHRAAAELLYREIVDQGLVSSRLAEDD
jgi:lysophospholipase L1-like esterase